MSDDVHANVFISAVIDAPIDIVWSTIRDFNDLPKWHSMITHSEIVAGRPGDAVGSVRDFTLANGAELKEKLLSLSDIEHWISYSIEDSPLPIVNYVASLSLEEITEGNQTLGRWQAAFDIPLQEREETEDLVATIFRTGLSDLNELLK